MMPRNLESIWPELAYSEWKDTCTTLHLWMQVVGKLKLKLNPYVNHWWEVAFQVCPRGVRSGVIPDRYRALEVTFDFLEHKLFIDTSEGDRRIIKLENKSVAKFYSEFMGHLEAIDVSVKLDTEPKEVANPIRFERDTQHATYDPQSAQRFHRVLLQSDRVLNQFRGLFTGKSSPVHFFWGSFDLAVTRFSGRKAPARPNADHITQLAYSHEVISCGFWPGGGAFSDAAFYAYAAPEPEGFSSAQIAPSQAFYSNDTHGFLLKYEDVRKSKNPDEMIQAFCQSTYETAANLASWDRKALERGSISWNPKRVSGSRAA